jgi:hypothetical protein
MVSSLAHPAPAVPCELYAATLSRRTNGLNTTPSIGMSLGGRPIVVAPTDRQLRPNFVRELKALPHRHSDRLS